MSPREGIELAIRVLRNLSMDHDEIEVHSTVSSRLGAWADGWIGERQQVISGNL